MKVVHDIPLAELDGQHAKSVDCPCGVDVEVVNRYSSIAYHQRVSPTGEERDRWRLTG